jgi:DNA-directed RNA polymerase subunit RPC12/RpoP
MEERIIQKLPRRCPYCDEVIPEEVNPGEDRREERCPHCGRVFVRMSLEEAAKMMENE